MTRGRSERYSLFVLLGSRRVGNPFFEQPVLKRPKCDAISTIRQTPRGRRLYTNVKSHCFARAKRRNGHDSPTGIPSFRQTGRRVATSLTMNGFTARGHRGETLRTLSFPAIRNVLASGTERNSFGYRSLARVTRSKFPRARACFLRSGGAQTWISHRPNGVSVSRCARPSAQSANLVGIGMSDALRAESA